jgi:hypothetical protein
MSHSNFGVRHPNTQTSFTSQYFIALPVVFPLPPIILAPINFPVEPQIFGGVVKIKVSSCQRDGHLIDHCDLRSQCDPRISPAKGFDNQIRAIRGEKSEFPREWILVLAPKSNWRSIPSCSFQIGAGLKIPGVLCHSPNLQFEIVRP